jgi:Tol biopolymer transport system component
MIVAESGTLRKIFVVRRDGRDWQRLTNLQGSESDASFCAPLGCVFFARQHQANWELARWDLSERKCTWVHCHAGSDRQPQASPDGSQLAFVSDRFGGEELFLLDLNQPGEARRLTFDQGKSVSPQWSPDGRQLTYSNRRNGQSDLYLLDLSSGQETRLTASDEDEVDPRWSPDGKKLLFQVAKGRYSRGHLHIMELATRQINELEVSLLESEHAATWSPDGQHLAYLNYHSPRSPSSPALMSCDLNGQGEPLTLFRRDSMRTHWSYRQLSWLVGWPNL